MATGKITKGDKKRGKKIAGHMVWQNEDNSIEVSKALVEECGSVKAALRKLADKAGFKYDPDWTVQQLGKKLLDFAEEKQNKEKSRKNI